MYVDVYDLLWNAFFHSLRSVTYHSFVYIDSVSMSQTHEYISLCAGNSF